MRKTMLFFMLFAVLFASLGAVCADDSNSSSEPEEEGIERDYVFSGWVKEGESFEINGKTYVAAAGDTTRSAIIMGPESVFVVDDTRCVSKGGLNFCLEAFKYTVGGDIVIHGSDTQEFYLKVYEPGAILSINRDISSSKMMVGETARVTIDIVNEGDDPGLGMTYTEEVPREFEITNTYGLEQYGNRLEWKGSIAGLSTKSFSYDIKAKSKYNSVVAATLAYKSGNTAKTITNNLAFRSIGLFNLNFDADKPEIEPGEEDRFYVTVENSKDAESSYKMVITVPESLEIVASHINSTEGNDLVWEGSIEAESEVKLTTAVKALYHGVASLKATVTDSSDLSSSLTKYFNITVLSKEPEIYLVHGDIFAENESQINFYLKNPSTYITIKNIDITVNSPLFNKSGSVNEFKPKEYNHVLSVIFTPVEPGKYNVSAEVAYKSGDKTFKSTKEEIIEVKDKGAAGAEEPASQEEPANQTEQPANETAGNESANITEGEAEEEAEPGFFANALDSLKSFFGRIKDMVIFWK